MPDLIKFLGILQYGLANPGFTREEIEKEFGITRSTIYRLFNDMRFCGVEFSGEKQGLKMCYVISSTGIFDEKKISKWTPPSKITSNIVHSHVTRNGKYKPIKK